MQESETKKLESEIHNEFQLERVVLFSDAVFAIAITLLVIDLKFPEVSKGETMQEFLHSLQPTIFNFFALVVSFFFIGMYWYRHLKLCGLLIDYNRTFIILNLAFLFFIVLFPFTVSSMMHITPSFKAIPSAVYFSNIFFTSLTHLILYNYLLGKGKEIAKPVSEAEKKHLLFNSSRPVIFIFLLGIFLVISLTQLDDQPVLVAVAFAVILIGLFLFRRRSRMLRNKLLNQMRSDSQFAQVEKQAKPSNDIHKDSVAEN